MTPRHDIKKIASRFPLPGDFISATPFTRGHINDTYVADFEKDGRCVRHLIQRVNHDIFRNVPAMMENVGRVTRHAAARLQADGCSEVSRRVLTVIPTHEGLSHHCDEAGNFWRVFIFIENTRSHDAIESVEQAHDVARAFGNFQKLLVDLPGGRLNETIPNFHHTRSRFDALMQAVAEDRAGRAASVRAEIDFFRRREPVADVLLGLLARGEIPERVTHNDTKLNNVLFDAASGEAVCVIDLDTVMPGLALYDFGDMVRTATSPAPEDERDLSKVRMQMPMFGALVGGYLGSAGGFLNDAEKAHLAFSGRLITFETGARFLTDHLQGDVYFKIHRPQHNLDRARTQMKLVESIEEQEESMQKTVARLVSTATKI